MWPIAKNTAKELLRDKVFGLVLVFGLLLMGGGLFIQQLTFIEGQKLVLDFGLGTLTLFLLLYVFYQGSSLLIREFDQKTIMMVLSKPVSRGSFVIGKFLGFSFVLTLLFLLFVVLLGILMGLSGIGWTWALGQALLALFIEALFILSMLFALSSVLRPTLTIFCSVALFFAGSTMPYLMEYLRTQEPTILNGVSWLYYVVPNFGIFHIGDVASYNIPLHTTALLALFGYGVLYSMVFLGLSILVIERKELL